MYYFKIYFLLISQYIKSRLQYKVDFFISNFAMLYYNLSGIVSIWIIFETIPEINGWTFDELFFMYAYAMLSLSPLQLFFDNVWNLSTNIKNGNFIKYYLKPLNIMFYYMSEIFDFKGISQLILGILAMVYSSIRLGIEWDMWTLCLLFISLVSSSLVMISIMLASETLAFWTGNSNALTSFIFKLREFSYYPMDIFNYIFKILLTVIIPVGFISYYPSKLFVRGQNDLDIAIIISPGVGFLFFAAAYMLWKKGLRNYTSTGS